jgi:hypothetical protein
VLVPVGTHVEPACEQALVALEQRGYCVRRVYGYAAIDQARNDMATTALADGFEETMWIDSDIAFERDAVDRLRSQGLPLACGIYARKGMRALACHVLPGTTRLVFGAEGGLIELLYAGTGFFLVRRQVYLDMQERLALPVCNEQFGRPTIPFFQPFVVPVQPAAATQGLAANGSQMDADRGSGQLTEGSEENQTQARGTVPFCSSDTAKSGQSPAGNWYLAEDFAFCERARQCGYKIMADTTIRLWHHGSYGYTWEDAGKDKERYETFYFDVQ